MTVVRSFLFIPGDSERKLAKADDCGADALILDLEDAVMPARKAAAREFVAAFLRARPPGGRAAQIWVRINPLDGEFALPDLACVVQAAPDGIMLPKAAGPAEVLRLSHYLDALEVRGGIAAGSVRILPVASETAAATLRIAEYATAPLARLAGLTWGAEDLAASLGASGNVDASGQWDFTYRMVRSMILLAAHAAGVPAIDTLYIDYRDEAGLLAACRTSRAEGFGGRLAIHPAQIAAIHAGYAPSEAEIAHAHRVIAAFAAAEGAGAVGLDGRMLDLPHLKQAQTVLAQVRK